MSHYKETNAGSQGMSSTTSSTSSSSSKCSSSSSAAPPSSSVDSDASPDPSADLPLPLPHTAPSLPSPTASSSPSSSFSSSTSSSSDAEPDSSHLQPPPSSSSTSSSPSPTPLPAPSVSGAMEGSLAMDVDRGEREGVGEGKDTGSPASSAVPVSPSDGEPSLQPLSLSSSSSSSSSASFPPEGESAALSLPSTASSSSSSSSTCSSSSSPVLVGEGAEVQSFLRRMFTADVKKGEASARAILKMLLNAQRAPNKAEHRRMRRDNVVVKRSVMDVPGALALMEWVGFRSVELKGLPYIALSDSPDDAALHSQRLTTAIAALQECQERQSEEEKKPTAVSEGSRVRCAGGCGYWGDPSQEGLCSICHKAKYLGAAAVRAMTGIAATGAAKKCVKGCGLFGSDKLNGLCSVCDSKERAKAAQASSSSPTAATEALPPTKLRWKRTRTKMRALHLLSLGKQAPQENKGRCFVCSKRLPVPIECRCRRTFCSSHRFPLDHQCSYDAQSEHKKKLRKSLQLQTASKMDRI